MYSDIGVIVEPVLEMAQYTSIFALAGEKDGRVLSALSRRQVPFHPGNYRDVGMPCSYRADRIDELRRSSLAAPVAVIRDRDDVATVFHRGGHDGLD